MASSVVSYETCPRCNFDEAIHDYYYHEGQLIIFCPQCGYFKSDPPDAENPDALDAYGAYYCESKTGLGASIGCIPDEITYNNVVAEIKANSDKVTCAKITRFVNGEIVTEVIIEKGE